MARKAGQTKRVRVAESIYKVERKDGPRYQVAIYHGANGEGPAKRKWHTLPAGTTLPQAKKAKRELEDAKHIAPPKAGETVREFFDKWEQRFPHRKKSTNRHNRERVSAFVKDFGDRPLDSITRAEARDWVVEHPSRHREVRTLFSDAVELDLIATNPFEALRLQKSDGRRKIRVLNEDELRKLVYTAKHLHGEYGEHFADLILIAAWTGMRPGELFALIPERIDLTAGVIEVAESADNKSRELVSTKTLGGERQIVILPEARAALERVLEYRTPGEFLFQSPQARDRFHSDGRAAFGGATFGDYWRPVRNLFTANLPASHWLPQRVKRNPKDGLVVYELRHLFGTRLAQKGALPWEIADQMGQSDKGKTAMAVYIHPDPEDVQKRIQGLFAA